MHATLWKSLRTPSFTAASVLVIFRFTCYPSRSLYFGSLKAPARKLCWLQKLHSFYHSVSSSITKYTMLLATQIASQHLMYLASKPLFAGCFFLGEGCAKGSESRDRGEVWLKAMSDPISRTGRSHLSEAET